jgi:hypothetical protein
MGAIVVGLRPGDHARLQQLARAEGRRPQELAGIFLDDSAKHATGRGSAGSR